METIEIPSPIKQDEGLDIEPWTPILKTIISSPNFHANGANSANFSLSLHPVTMTRNITQYPAKQLKLPMHWHNTERHVSIHNSTTPSTNTKNWKISQNGKRTSFLQIIPPNSKQPKTSNQSAASDIQPIEPLRTGQLPTMSQTCLEIEQTYQTSDARENIGKEYL